MTTQTRVLDFKYLVNKQMKGANEMKGIRTKHPTELISKALDNVLNDNNHNFKYKMAVEKKYSTYFDCIREALRVFKYNYNGSFINIKEVNNELYEITYTTHNEPKEFILGVYIGKETGNIYFSNQGDDIVVDNLSSFSNTPDFKVIVACFQRYKADADFDKLVDSLNSNRATNSKGVNPYVLIFSSSSTDTAVNNKSDVNDSYKGVFKDLAIYLNRLSSLSQPFIYAFKLIQQMLSYSIGRISKFSEDMELLVSDFNMMTTNEYCNQIKGYLFRLEPPKGLFNQVATISSTEYLVNEVIQNSNSVSKDMMNDLMLKSLIDNSADAEASLYSDEYMDKLGASLMVDSLKLKQTRRNLLGNLSISPNFMTSLVKDAFSRLSSTDYLSVMSNFNKTVYKYLQRIHKILETL